MGEQHKFGAGRAGRLHAYVAQSALTDDAPVLFQAASSTDAEQRRHRHGAEIGGNAEHEGLVTTAVRE